MKQNKYTIDGFTFYGLKKESDQERFIREDPECDFINGLLRIPTQ